MEMRKLAPRGMVVTPHHLATQSAIDILREGGTAMEAVVAAAATIAVVYPHMNSIGGDGFWLILPPEGDPVVIEACGAAGSLANLEFFKGYNNIPYKGPKSAITVAGTVGGWQEALNYVTECGYQRMSAARLLSDAITYAEHGFPVSSSHVENLTDYMKVQAVSNDFQRIFLPDGKIPEVGDKFCQKTLANTLMCLAKYGFDSFYRGELAEVIASDLKSVGAPITKEDLAKYAPVRKQALKLLHSQGEIYNVPPPSQGLVSMAILGILDKLSIDGNKDDEFIHAVVEASKQAFSLRDQHVTDPAYMTTDPKHLLSNETISEMARKIDLKTAVSKNHENNSGDTIWLAVMDNKGYSVSFIQSTYHEFGSGVVLPTTGILWHNRGVAYSLDKNHILALKPGKKPLHTLNPAAAKLNDGRVMLYGTRGGDGQPQTQAAIFHRYVLQGMPLQESVSAPRWLYGRTVGDKDNYLKVEDRFSKDTLKRLFERGHTVKMLPPFSEKVGQAGALVRHVNGMMEGAFDPRSNGSAEGY